MLLPLPPLPDTASMPPSRPTGGPSNSARGPREPSRPVERPQTARATVTYEAASGAISAASTAAASTAAASTAAASTAASGTATSAAPAAAPVAGSGAVAVARKPPRPKPKQPPPVQPRIRNKGPGEPKEPGDACLDGLYSILSSVGRGAFGEIWLVRHTTKGGDPVVLKEIALKGLSASEVRQARLEVDVLRRVTHAHVVGFVSAFDDPAAVAILMEHAGGGDLGSVIDQRVRDGGEHIPADQMINYATQLASALAYLHNYIQLLHRDIKPANVFIRSNGDVCLGDFGMCKLIPAGPRINLIPRSASSGGGGAANGGGSGASCGSTQLPIARRAATGSGGAAPPGGKPSARLSNRSQSGRPVIERPSLPPPPKPPKAAAKPSKAKKSKPAASNPYDNAVGTPLYMSPEHITGSPFDRDADVWAFACTLYETMGLTPVRTRVSRAPLPKGGGPQLLIRSRLHTLSSAPSSRPRRAPELSLRPKSPSTGLEGARALAL